MASFPQRIERLESHMAPVGNDLVIFVRFVSPGQFDAEPQRITNSIDSSG